MTDRQTTPSPGISAPERPAPPSTGQRTPQATAQVDAVAKAARPWFKKKRIVVPSAVVLLAGVILVSTNGYSRLFDLSAMGSKVASTPKIAPAKATIGQSVRDGGFAFVVTSVQRPSKTLTDRSRHTQTAEGAFVVVRVNVTNIGYAPENLTATDQFLVNNKGQRFATSSAISSLQGTEKIFLEKVNPGHTVNSAPLLFDVPAGTSIASIELHDSLTSTGVKVKLR